MDNVNKSVTEMYRASLLFFLLSICAGIGSNHANALGLLKFSPAPDKGNEPLYTEVDRIVGIGMNNKHGHVYAWTQANTVSSGIPSNFAWNISPYRYSPLSGVKASTIVSMAIAKSDSVYTWYINGKRSVGVSHDLDAYGNTRSYTIPGGRTHKNIVAIAIDKKKDNKVFTWFDDGYVSVGHSRNLGAYTGRGKYWSSERKYTLANSRTPADVVGIAIDPDTSHVFTWYRDGYASEGAIEDLDYHREPFHYTRHGILRSVYPPSSTKKQSSGRVSVIDSDKSIIKIGTADPVQELDINNDSYDNVVAAGHNYFAVSFDASVQFYHRDGTVLTGDNLTHDGKLKLNNMFAPFVRTKPNGSDPRPLDVNHYIDIPHECDVGFPSTRGYYFCVTDNIYDTRVNYDKNSRRFVILAQIRNPIWTSLFSNDPDEQWCGISHSVYAWGWKSCEVHDAGENGIYSRRLKILAISRTEDPREGFYTYVFVQNNQRDWPWMAINGDWLILSNIEGKYHIDGPVATLMPLSDLRAGKIRPEFIHYYRYNLNNTVAAEPPQHHGDLPTHSFLTGRGSDNKWRVFTLTHPAAPYAKVTPKNTVIDMQAINMKGILPERAVYRDGFLHLVNQVKQNGDGNFYNIEYSRLRMTLEGNDPKIWYDDSRQRKALWKPKKYLDYQLSFEDPAIQVNHLGDTFIVFGQSGQPIVDPYLPKPGIPVAKNILGMLWPYNQFWRVEPKVLKWGAELSGSSHGNQVYALNADVDPNDDYTFWGIHKFVADDESWDTFVGTFSSYSSPPNSRPEIPERCCKKPLF